MAIFKCKMCGGTLEINNNETVATCEYCGTQQTLPKLDGDRRINLYDRANHFRRNNEFDKAMGIYEQILNEDCTDAEAYWSIVLCRYGIEYVEDPASHKRIPTVNRAQFTSIYADDDYKSALKYADVAQKEVYEQEAKAIDDIQKGILEISNKEEPFDVFICYKETDANGRRTQDSVLANDLYHQLVQEGFKVFFSRITLEDKLGVAYEPYIFAALNSAKVMVVLGTKPEYFNAVWVKNEWSRYLALIKQGKNKMLIPAYKDMDPYDLPEEFSHLQAQDMSKLGFMQDLIRGIKKIVETDAPKSTDVKEKVAGNKNADIEPLLKRAFIFLEDSDWKSANEYCERALDIDPENAYAYLGKLLIELKVRNPEALKEQTKPFDDNSNYQKAIRFADEKLKVTLEDYVEHIKKIKCDSIYIHAKNAMSEANTERAYKKAATLFESISDYQDSSILAQSCHEKAEHIAKRVAERNKKMWSIITYAMCAVIAVFAVINVLNTVIVPNIENNIKYNDAVALMDEGNIIEAYEALIALDGYKDSADKAASIFDKYKIEKIKNAKAGDYIFLGTYEQDNNTPNGKEDIEWLVLEVDSGRALIISKYGLDCKRYNASKTNVTWETCTLRKWLNDDFINTAFSDNEKAKILTVKISTTTRPSGYGHTTQDQVFLLSTTEADKCFSNGTGRCTATDYAVANGARKIKSGNCRWWLRSSGFFRDKAAFVNADGVVLTPGDDVDSTINCVRPALWIDLNS